jgi:hypothetical protein
MFAASKSGSVEASDPQFNYVTMLLHGDGTNGAQNNTFLDSSTNNFTITRNGNTTQGTFTPYGSNWSNYFDGTSGQFLNAPANAAFNFGTGDFTIEGFVFPTSTSGTRPIVEIRTTGGANGFALLSQSGATTLNIFTNSGFVGASTNSLTTNQWNHVALTRSGNTWTYWINGVSGGSFTNTSTQSDGATTGPKIGGSSTSGEVWVGYLSNIRIVKGTCLYTSTFTPSTTPLTAISGTSLLTCQSNRFIDNSTNAFAITVNGSPSVQRFSPFSPTTAYSTSVIGGSGYFDGSGDSISAPDSAAFNMTGTSYCFETWIYPTTSAEMSIFSRCSGTGLPGLSIQKLSNGQILFSTNDDYSTSSGTTVLANTWSHIACTYDGSTKRVFLNGALMGSTSSSWSEVATAMTIGDRPSDSRHFYMVGYVSNSRIVKGSAVYTSAFTPPTAPLSAISGTSLLLNYTNAGILDNAMMNDLETVGNAQISTSVKKYGTGSLAFDGAGDRLVARGNPAFNFGSGDFTVELWLYLNSVSANQWIVGPDDTSTFPWAFQTVGTAIRFISNNAANDFRPTSFTLTTGTWNHFAVTRSGSTMRWFTNGTLNGSQTYSNSIGSDTINLQMGTTGSGSGDPLNGYIDDLRITKGVARYTASFTAPTTAFADKG